MAISANDVKSLRDRTNAPLMECKTALTESGGDIEKAIDLLRKKAGSKIGNVAARETAEGRIAVFLDSANKAGSIFELRCESAPVSKTDQFVQLANELAKQITVTSPPSVDDLVKQTSVDHPGKLVSDRVMDVFQLVRENIKPHRFVRLTGLLGDYVHHNGSVGVLLQVEGDSAEPQLLRDICMHIAARNPVAGAREEVPADKLAKETEIAREQTTNDPKNAGKPANIIERIIEGKMKTWLADNVLLEQPFVKDDTKTVQQLLTASKLKFVKFIRYQIGQL